MSRKRAFGFQKICNFNALENVTVANLDSVFVISISNTNTHSD